MEDLIFDRAQLDIDNDTEKGNYNYNDLNRIETWCEYLANLLISYSYPVSIKTKNNWNMSDFPASSEMERIRQNVNRLKEAYFSFTQIPENLEYMTFEKANYIEKILYEINELLENMIQAFYYSNDLFCGEV